MEAMGDRSGTGGCGSPAVHASGKVAQKAWESAVTETAVASVTGYVADCSVSGGMRNILEDGRIAEPAEGTICRYVDLLSDVGFKLVFGKEANKDILIEFLNCVIPEHRICDLEYMDKEKHGGVVGDRGCVFDVYCRTDSGSRIIVEVQKRSHDWYVERALYYSTFPIQDQLESGDMEYRLCPVYVISILQDRLLGKDFGPCVRSSFRLYEDNSGMLLTEKYNIILIELGKFVKGLSELDGSALDGFYYSLKNMGNLLDRPVELQQKVFARLFDAARVSRMDKLERHKYRKTMLTKRDIWCIQETDRRIAREEERIRMAKNFLSLGVSIETIVKATGLTEDKIRVAKES